MARPLCDTPPPCSCGEEENGGRGGGGVRFNGGFVLCVCVFLVGGMHHNFYCFHHSAGLPLLGIDSVVNLLLS